ncbi:MAG: DUF1475 family protein, partial [Phycisphaerales bacterium]
MQPPTARTSGPVRIAAVLAAVVAMGMVVMIVDASLEKSVLEIFRVLFAEKWGVVTLVDLYAGFVVTGTWIVLCERRAVRYLPWLAAMALLGNLATLVYIAWRGFRAQSLRDLFMPTPPGAKPRKVFRLARRCQ